MEIEQQQHQEEEEQQQQHEDHEIQQQIELQEVEHDDQQNNVIIDGSQQDDPRVLVSYQGMLWLKEGCWFAYKSLEFLLQLFEKTDICLIGLDCCFTTI